MVARLVWDQEAAGSTPVTSTTNTITIKGKIRNGCNHPGYRGPADE